MAGREPINDTTLEALQTIDGWNSALLQVLFETAVKSGAVEAEALIAKVSEMAERLQSATQMPSASGYIQRRSTALCEDILFWHKQSREDG
jgi:hypothetical protein